MYVAHILLDSSGTESPCHLAPCPPFCHLPPLPTAPPPAPEPCHICRFLKRPLDFQYLYMRYVLSLEHSTQPGPTGPGTQFGKIWEGFPEHKCLLPPLPSSCQVTCHLETCHMLLWPLTQAWSTGSLHLAHDWTARKVTGSPGPRYIGKNHRNSPGTHGLRRR